MEFGPRALGNRSILADPRNPATKDAVNLKVKGREPFRPLGPSVKVEAVHEFFECCLPLPFMIVACPVRPDKIGLIPSVVHVDGTARIQTVSSETNPLFWQLLDEFEKLTRIPLLLNTSFNRKGEPIVCKPKDAVQTFLSIGLDYLAIGNYLVWKS
jgi:carbamoyltransferase